MTSKVCPECNSDKHLVIYPKNYFCHYCQWWGKREVDSEVHIGEQSGGQLEYVVVDFKRPSKCSQNIIKWLGETRLIPSFSKELGGEVKAMKFQGEDESPHRNWVLFASYSGEFLQRSTEEQGVKKVMADDIIVGQMKNLNSFNRPKYITLGHDMDSIYMRNLYPVEVYDRRTTPNVVVIVEDIASCIRVGNCFQSISTLGTHVSEKKFDEICERVGVNWGNPNVLVWFDDDDAGTKGCNTLVNRLEMIIPGRVGRIRTEKDPKMYTDKEIREIVTDEFRTYFIKSAE